MSQADSNAAFVAASAPVTPSSVDAALISTDSREGGLWLWQGKSLPPPSLPQPKSRVQQILARIVPVARRLGWLALPGGFALTFLAVSIMPRSAPPPGPVSSDAPAVALPPPSSPTVSRPIVAGSPGDLIDGQLHQAQILPPPAQIMARGPEQRMAKWHPQRKSGRTVRKNHVWLVRRGPAMLVPGVLTPPPMTGNGGGY